jgi:hypothetical protein
MKNIYLSCFLCLCFTFSFGQTNISGIINTYTPVSALTNSGCATCSNPACYTDVTVGSTAGFTAGGIALIMQMKGAVIDETNTASFGNISNNNNTGNFEYANIISIPNGTTVRVSTLALSYSLPSSPSPGLVQLISVPVYNGNVNVSGMLTAQPWNGATGGVLTFIASGKVTLNANIDVSGRGFRGFLHHENSLADCTETLAYYVSDATAPNSGAFKGEGVALTIVNKERGRGKQANGGGGGVGHNGGGGGGGNGGVGGFGGQMYNGCTSIEGRGQGGLALTGSSTRVFMGGGGGTGDSNGTGPGLDPGGDGTNGGGIIMILADSIVNTNSTVGYTGTTGPIHPSSNQYLASPGATEAIVFDVLCQLTLNSILVNAGAAQTVTVRVLSNDRANVLYGPVSVAVAAGVNTVPLGFNIVPGTGYMLSLSGTTGTLMFGNTSTGAYPYTVPDVISITGSEPNGPGKTIAYAFNWNVTARCASGGYKINASGIDNPATVVADGGGAGGAGGSIYIKANGYRGIINMMAAGGQGADMLGGGCHAPGGGGAGGYICMNTVPPVNVYRNVTGAAPGLIPYDQATCLTPPTGYNSYAATKGTNGQLCTVLLSTPPCSLPVELISFTGRKEGDANLLNWSVATEKDNDYFVIERSINGIDFISTGSVDGKGNVNDMQTYSFKDDHPFNGVNYYRLKQVDFNGSFSYSNIIAIINQQADINIYPNPNNGTFVISLMAPAHAYQLDVTDLHGRTVYTMKGDEVPESIEVKDLAGGVYIVRFYQESQVYIKKLVVY